MTTHPLRRLALALPLLALASAALAQSGSQAGSGAGTGAQPGTQASPPTGAAGGLTREQMWWAPTAEDWKKPCLVRWQRTMADAIAVSKETNKAILVCVNMDGEPASEHYAGVRYRQPEIAKLYEPYVTVIASVYRHTPRDFDEQGRRILCPRFGSVTCGEHIAIEPGLHDKYFEDRRVAPRHIMLELDSAEVYDVYYAFDTDSVFQQIREGIENRKVEVREIVRSDRPVLERVESQHIDDREAVEAAYLAGDRDAKRALLEKAIAGEGVHQVDLLRLALFGFDLELSRMARQGLAKANEEKAVDLIAEALRVPMEPAEREALIAALTRIGATSPRARSLASAHQGLAGRSSVVDTDGWASALKAQPKRAPLDHGAAAEVLDAKAQAADARPEDPALRLEIAQAFLDLAIDPRMDRKHDRLYYEDARSVALEAEKLGAYGWTVNATLAIAAARLGDMEEARKRAVAAMPSMPEDAQGWSSAAVLELFAQARERAIIEAVRAKKEWPGQWMADVHAAYSVLARHPYGTDVQFASHHDFLRWFGAAHARQVLEEGLARFPDSWILHDRLRARILAEKGAEGLEPAYAELLRADGASPNLEWFAGYASIVAAEFRRRRGQDDEALAAYDRAVAHFERNLEDNPTSRESVDHYVALVHAGRARIAYERGQNEEALRHLLASLERKPEAAASQDGLNLSPMDTARMLRVRFGELKRDDLGSQLQAALDKLDPELLRLPAYERQGPGQGGGRGRRQGG